MQSNVWLQSIKSYVRIGGREVTDMKITEKFNKIFDKKIHLDLKKKDWALIVIVLCVAGLAFLLHQVVGGSGAGSVVVKVEGEIEGVYDLSEDQEIEINGNVFRTKKIYAVCCKIVVPLAMFLVLFGQLQTFGIIK